LEVRVLHGSPKSIFEAKKAGIGLKRGRFFIDLGGIVNLILINYVNLIFYKEAGMDSSFLNLQNLIQGFKISCQTEGKSPRTVTWYTTFLEKFRIFLERNGLPARADRLDKLHVRHFILYLQQEARTPRTHRHLSGATVQGYVRTLKAFFAWLAREEYINANFMAKIPVPKAETKVITTLSSTQIQSLFKQCLSSSRSGPRNMLIMLLLIDCGLRVSELVGIDTDDIYLEEGIIRIRKAKGSKERYVPVGSVTKKFLWKYLNTVRPKPLAQQINRLFLNNKGLPFTDNGVQQMLRRYGKKVGITGVRCSPHTFRYTFAKDYLMNGGDIFSLQKILGHSSLASVRLYLNLFGADVKKQHQRFSPVDNLAPRLTGCRF
jgi:integrase/recombinase XerD